MAKRHDVEQAAAKARKQKIILGIAGVLLLGLAGIQGPKLWKQLNPPAPQAVAAPATATPGAQVVPSGSPAPVSAVGDARTILSSVATKGGAVGGPNESQLVSFTLFETKDPFVPQLSDKPVAGTPAAGPTATAPAGPSSTGGAPASAPAGGTAATPALPPTYATIELNGAMQQLKLKDAFPKVDPVFVLKSLKRKAARIAVAGGTFKDFATVELKLGKKTTLMDVATGVRYVVELVYTGSAPEQVESFTTATATPAK